MVYFLSVENKFTNTLANVFGKNCLFDRVFDQCVHQGDSGSEGIKLVTSLM